MEKGYEEKTVGSSDGSPTPHNAYDSGLQGQTNTTKNGIGRRIWDSFKRDPNATVTKPGAVGADGKVFDSERAAQRTADSPLSKRLKGRHLQMIAIGGSIGRFNRQEHGAQSHILQVLVFSSVLARLCPLAVQHHC